MRAARAAAASADRTQNTAEVLPASLAAPSGQGEQAERELAPALLQKVFGGHKVQVEDPGAPAKDPGGHCAQATLAFPE